MLQDHTIGSSRELVDFFLAAQQVKHKHVIAVSSEDQRLLHVHLLCAKLELGQSWDSVSDYVSERMVETIPQYKAIQALAGIIWAGTFHHKILGLSWSM